MNCLVTYSSEYGYTKQYAQWIADALGCGILPAKKGKPTLWQGYDVIIHGGGLYAGSLSGLKPLVKHYDKLRGKTLILFTCGIANPQDHQNVANMEAGIAKVLTPEMQNTVKQFHFRGGIDYARMRPMHKAMMAMMRKIILQNGPENLRDDDKVIVDSYGKSADFLDPSSIAPLVEYVKQLAL